MLVSNQAKQFEQFLRREDLVQVGIIGWTTESMRCRFRANVCGGKLAPENRKPQRVRVKQ